MEAVRSAGGLREGAVELETPTPTPPRQGTGRLGPALVPRNREAGCLSYPVTLPLRSFAECIS